MSHGPPTAEPTAPSPRAEDRPPEFSRAYTRYALGLLLVVYVVNFLDRQVLSILLESIKADLEVSDSALGFLSGIAFALLYSTLGIPIASWADRGSRRSIIALALFVWSGMTVLQGRATGFATLALARVGVGIGEAGCSPPSHSLLADLFPPSTRSTALAIYSMGIPIGGAIGYLAGGWLDELFGWRTAFVVVGAPGVVLAFIVRATLRDPTRGYWSPPRPSGAAASEDPPVRMRDAWRFMVRLPAFLHLAMAAALHAFYGYGAAAFNPAFYRRVHEFDQGELGSWLAAVSLFAGVAGTWVGGALTDRLARLDMRWLVWIPGGATLAGVPFVIGTYLWPERYESMWFLAGATFFASFYYGPTFALTQGLAPPRMRAQAAAILLLIINLIGLGLGPQFVGWLSDQLVPHFASGSIRYSLVWTVSACAVWSTLHYVLSARSLREDLRAQQSA
jgi:MFS family permease